MAAQALKWRNKNKMLESIFALIVLAVSVTEGQTERNLSFFIALLGENGMYSVSLPSTCSYLVSSLFNY